MLAVTFGPFPTTVMTAPGPLGLASVVGVTVVTDPLELTWKEKGTSPSLPDLSLQGRVGHGDAEASLGAG